MTGKPWELPQDEYDADRASVPIHTRGPDEGQPIPTPTFDELGDATPFVPDPADVDPYAEDEMQMGRGPGNQLRES